jgi:two-component system cell cycle sensor histidine kinase/response regulator CckA
VTTTPIYDNQGNMTGSVHVAHDITERRRAEEELKASRNELEERVQQRTAELSDAYDELQAEMKKRKKTEEQLRQAHKMEAIGTLAGGIAHDFNNLLAAIMGFTEMVIEDLPEGGQEVKNLRHVLKSAHRGRDLVKQILTFSRKSDSVRGSMSLTPLITETIQLLRASIPSTIKIVFKTSATLDTVLASPTEVQQMLMNLATNAALAMQDKGGTLEINLNDIDIQSDASAFELDIEPGEYIQLVFRDAGSGMTPEVMKRIFEPFFTTREVGKGTGMGLAVVYGIVTDLNGTITVESEPGVGSLFRVFLPKIKSDVKSVSVKADDSPGGTERVLFLDDEELLVEWGHAALTRLGYKVTSMTDSIGALKTFSADPAQFDLVVTDQTMPGLTGIQLARELLALRRDIPIILFTGHSETVTPEEAQTAGIREFLMKPFGKQELAGAMRRVLDIKR